MDELIKTVSQKTGLSEEMARKAVEAVIGFLKKKLPAPIFAQVEGFLGQGETGVDDVVKGLGGLLGG